MGNMVIVFCRGFAELAVPNIYGMAKARMWTFFHRYVLICTEDLFNFTCAD